jgi:hypothetical protein
VFEPNSEPTGSVIRTASRGFLRQDDLNGGDLICLTGIAPIKRAEFVIFRIPQNRRTTTVDALRAAPQLKTKAAGAHLWSRYPPNSPPSTS